MSVEIDRRDDWYLRTHYLEMFRDAGLANDVDGIRKACGDARAKGLAVFPPCDHTDAKGHCLGHDDPGAQSIAEVP